MKKSQRYNVYIVMHLCNFKKSLTKYIVLKEKISIPLSNWYIQPLNWQ